MAVPSGVFISVVEEPKLGELQKAWVCYSSGQC